MKPVFTCMIFLTVFIFLPLRIEANEIIHIPNGIIEPCTGAAENKNGLHTQYYQDGNVYMETSCANGLKQGAVRKYYPNGSLWSEATYFDNQLEGTMKTYYRDGMVKSEDNYKSGQLDGLCQTYFQTSELSSKKTYAKGKLIAPEVKFDRNGVILKREIFDGKQTRYINASKFLKSPKQNISSRESAKQGNNEILKYQPYLQ